MRAAGDGLRLNGDIVCTHDDAVHGNVEQDAQGVEVVDGGKRLSGLPLVDRAGLQESEPVLQILYGQSSLFAQAGDVLSGCHRVNRRESQVFQGYRLL